MLQAAVSLPLAACSTVPADDDAPPLVYPPPPAEPHFRYETSIRSGADLVRQSRSEQLRRMALGLDSQAETSFVKPFDVAAAGGMLYVSDTALRLVHAFDLARRRYFRLGYRLAGQLDRPLAMDLDASGRLYVVDGSQKKVFVYDNLGLHLATLSGPQALDRPIGIAVDTDGRRIVVVDAGGAAGHHRLVELAADGSIARYVGSRGAGPGEFNLPVAASFMKSGGLAVLDAGNFRVQLLDHAFRPRLAFGSVGNGPGQFARPKDIAVDDLDRIYVSDTAFGNIQIFEASGRLLMSIGQFASSDLPGGFTLLSGIAIDETGRIYATDQLNRKVSTFVRQNHAQA